MTPERLEKDSEARDILENLIEAKAEQEPVGLGELETEAQTLGLDVSREQISYTAKSKAEEGDLETKKLGKSRNSPRVFWKQRD